MEALTSLLAPQDVEMDDTAFGAMPLPATWDLMFFGGKNSSIRTWHTWLCEDGSTGGSLWTWSGTADNGEPFDLIGINISSYDENGLMTHTVNNWPYEADNARRALQQGNQE